MPLCPTVVRVMAKMSILHDCDRCLNMDGAAKYYGGGYEDKVRILYTASTLHTTHTASTSTLCTASTLYTASTLCTAIDRRASIQSNPVHGQHTHCVFTFTYL